MRFDNRSAWLLPLVLIAALIAVPASWASKEEIKSEDSAGSADEAKPGKTDEAEKEDPTRCVDGKPLASFNTVEDIQAHKGSSESLLATPEAAENSASEVTWRKVEDPATEKTEKTSSSDDTD